MKNIAIDFETFYTKDYSIKTLGVDAYINDERFDAYLVAIWGDDDLQYVGHPKDFDWSQITGHRALAHNARFDETVFIRLKRDGVIPEDCTPSEWLCTADLAVYLQAPRNLAGAARALLGVKLDKDVRDEMAKITYAEAVASGVADKWHTYALDDAKYCYELFRNFGEQWTPLERQISRINREESRRGVAVDVQTLDENLKQLERTRWEAGNLIPWDWDDGKTPLSPNKLRLQCRTAGIPCPTSLAQDSIDCQNWEDQYGENYPWVGAMRDWRRSNIMLKKLQTLKARLEDGVFPYSIKYFGAHTGRFSGDGGFNMQNMPRGENMGVDIRGLFIPREGRKMVIADLAQIEARIILWLADDMDMLETIAEGHSVYEAHAIRTMNYDSSRGPLKKVDPAMYSLAKARVLGLGFGCGPARFKALAWDWMRLDLTDAEAQEIVTSFRTTNPKIVNLWNILQRDCAWQVGKTFTVELPSGRCLNYYNVRRDREGLTAEMECGGGKRVKVYGGKLAENLVQATARDVFVERMPELLKLGCHQLFHAHDEYVLEANPDVTTDAIYKCLTVTPDWLEGCPIDAEVMEVDRYCK